MRCPFCGSHDSVTDPARGDTVCGNPACGEVLQERTVVAQTTWVHSASGGCFAAGKEVEWGGFSQTSQELALARGITRLAFIADRLQLSAQIQEAGRRMYQLAVQMNFTVGRKSSCVAGACLYVVCRRSLSPHLLIDFADALQLPVKVIGQVYLRLIRRLVGADPRCPTPLGNAIVEVPVVDPSIFIERYSQKLDFGVSRRKVMNTAMRLIQFMHRDWICVGRRPNGLCGAALLIASFYHGHSISAKDIAEVVRMHEGTLRRRLVELRQTPLSTVRVAGFERGTMAEVPCARAPPCMQERRQQEALAAIAGVDRLPVGDGQVAGAEGKAERARTPPLLSTEAQSTPGPLPVQDDLSPRFTAREPSADDIETIARDVASLLQIEEIVERGAGSKWEGCVEQSSAAAKVEELLAGKPVFDDNPGSADAQASAATPASGCQEESLSDVDDEELDMYLLESDERAAKSDMWHEVNKDYLEEWYQRDLEKRRRSQRQASRKASSSSQASMESTSETGSSSGSGARRKRFPSTGSCTESAMLALTRKSKVGRNRINIEALERLFE